MSVMVHFPHSGVFDLNRWKLSVRVGEEDVTEQTKKGKGFYGSQSYAQTPNLPHLVSVHAVRSIL